MTEKTNTDRQRALRERRKAQGLLKVEVYAHADDHERIKTYVRRLNKKRENSHKDPLTNK